MLPSHIVGSVCKRMMALLLLVYFAFGGLPLGHAAIDDDPFLVQLHSRMFVPVPGVDSSLFSSSADVVHGFIQLTHFPSDEERSLLEQQGVEFFEYVPSLTWAASFRVSTIKELSSLSFVRAVFPLEPNDKLSFQVTKNFFDPYAILPDGRLALLVQFFRDVDLEHGREMLASYGEIGEEIGDLHAFTVAVAPKNIPSLAGWDEVLWIQMVPPPLTALNDGSRAILHVNEVQATPYGLNGNGVNLLVYDVGDVKKHLDFGNRVVFQEGGGAQLSEHSTHVAGTAAGSGLMSGGLYRGMAPAAKIISYYYQCGPYCLYNSVGDLAANYNQAIAQYNADIASNSLGSNVAGNGYSCTWEGDYELMAQLVDSIVKGSSGKLLPSVWAAGNERGVGTCGTSYYTLGVPATAKNAIVVGAVNSNDQSMTSFSSWGPTDDGRVKPDVVAAGSQVGGDGGITSTLVYTLYGINKGTSMAAPAVSGSLALLLQEWRMYSSVDPIPSMLKALLIHTADDLGPVGPDYQFGYGLVDVKQAVDVIMSDQGLSHQMISNTLSSSGAVHEYMIEIPSGQPSLRFTLAWDDVPATPLAAKTLVNNLDLQVYDPQGTLYLPWALTPLSPSQPAHPGVDIRNTVEQVDVSSPVSGLWKVRVVASNLPSPIQTYSLVLPFSVVVPNTPPTITSTPVITAVPHQLYIYDVDAVDAEQDVLTYNLTQSPLGMTIDTSTGLITWTPDVELPVHHSSGGSVSGASVVGMGTSPFPVIVKVTDSKGASATQSWTITLSPLHAR